MNRTWRCPVSLKNKTPIRAICILAGVVLTLWVALTILLESQKVKRLARETEGVLDEIRRRDCWTVNNPSLGNLSNYSEYNRELCGNSILDPISKFFDPISFKSLEPGTVSSIDGTSASITSKNSAMSLVVSDGWALVSWDYEDDRLDRTVLFFLANDDLTRSISNEAGLPYPITFELLLELEEKQQSDATSESSK